MTIICKKHHRSTVVLTAVFAAIIMTPVCVAADIDNPSAPIKTDTASMTARGVLRPGQTAEIAAGMSGRLFSVPYKSGQYFKRGAVLARFDCKRQEAELAALTVAHKTLSLKFENTNELYKAGAAGALDVSIAESEMSQASAEIEVINARLKDCVIYAPFAGYVTMQHMRSFETPALNAPIYSVLRAGSLEISVIAPSSWMRWAKPKQRFVFHVDETDTRMEAEIIRLGAMVDPVSQTIELTAKPRGKIGPNLAGMSGHAVFDTNITGAK
ncbi:efflux RND transporter periplasmic adaptor subunit [Fretibacter rubidus]|uniref:efflux RND transporter periplasmic adaptor subunit n=1 Tax=Fretibacter rubidus TaxID=570162 RepID=UPI00352A07EA